MKLTSPTTNGAFKHFKGQYVATALGLALAVSAAVAISGDLKNPSSHEVSGAPTRIVAFTSTGIEVSSRPQVVFYLVTDEQAARVQEFEELDQSVRLDVRVPEPGRSVVVVRAGTPEEEAASRKVIDSTIAASKFGSNTPAFQVRDMRNQ